MVKPDKTRSYSSLLKDLYRFLGEDKKFFVFAIFLMVIGTLCLSYAPKVAGQIIDIFSDYAIHSGVFNFNGVLSLLVLLLVLYVVGNVLDLFTNRIMINIARKVSYVLRNELQSKLHKVPINYLDSHSTGDIVARLTNDMSSVESMMESDLVNIMVQFVIIVLVFIMMLYVDMKLTLIYVIFVPISFLVIKFITSSTKKQYKKQQNAVGEINGFISDNFNNHLLIKSFNMEDKSKEKFDSINEKLFSTFFKSRFHSGFIIPINVVLTNLEYIAVCVFGGYLILNGQLSIGEFLAFILYGQMLTQPLITISSSLNIIQSGFSSLERVLDILEAPEEEELGGTEVLSLNTLEGNIKFENVEFGYSPEKTLMHDVSLNADTGMVMAIVGPSGAGKTTLVNLLMRFYEINNGAIYLDGTNIYKIEKNSFRKAFGMVLQDSWVFNGTIAENIAYGAENASHEDIVEAAELIGCDKFINLLPDGYETIISEENTNLSVGEKQLLVLARTIISDPKILILDEATSQMDTRTEFMVTKAMEEMMKGRTTFIIAHRLFTIKNADKIIFMQDGDIKEVGNHEELLKLDGLYADMYKSGSI